MERIETSKLNRGLKDVLTQVAEGKTIMLTRYGKDVARLSPPHDTRPEALKAAPDIRTDELLEAIDADPRFEMQGSPPKSNQNARDELLNKIRSRK